MVLGDDKLLGDVPEELVGRSRLPEEEEDGRLDDDVGGKLDPEEVFMISADNGLPEKYEMKLINN